MFIEQKMDKMQCVKEISFADETMPMDEEDKEVKWNGGISIKQ